MPESWNLSYLKDKKWHPVEVKGEFTAKCAELCSRYMEIFMRLGVHPTTEEEMVELETFLGESSGLLAALNGELNEARKSLRFLTEQAVGFEPEQLQIIGDTWCWPSKIKPKVEECNKRLKAERNRAEDELNDKVAKFIEELDDYVRQAEAFSQFGEIERMAENGYAEAAEDALKDYVKVAKGVDAVQEGIEALKEDLKSDAMQAELSAASDLRKLEKKLYEDPKGKHRRALEKFVEKHGATKVAKRAEFWLDKVWE